MKVVAAVACEAAIEDAGSLSILGTFDRIEASRLPVIKSQCAIALQIQWRKEEEGLHKVRAHFMNADGVTLLHDLESLIRVTVPDSLPFATTGHIVNLQQVKFTRAGTYMIGIRVDDRHVAEIELHVQAGAGLTESP